MPLFDRFLSSIQKPQTFITLAGVIGGPLMWLGLEYWLPQTSHNGISIFILSGTFIVCCLIFAYLAHKKINPIKVKGLKKMIFGIGAGIILIGIILIVSQLNFPESDNIDSSPISSSSENTNNDSSPSSNDSDLKNKAELLIQDIQNFISERNFNKPRVSASAQTKEDLDKIWQESVNYSAETNYLFTTNYRQRVINLANIFHDSELITNNELQELVWFAQPSYPSIDWLLGDLEKFYARLTGSTIEKFRPTTNNSTSIIDLPSLTFVNESDIPDNQIITLSFGSNAASSPWVYIKNGNSITPIVNGYDVQLKADYGRLYINALIYNPINPDMPIRIVHNSIQTMPDGWDANYDNGALEVVNEDGMPVLQIIYKSQYFVSVNGIFPKTNGGIVSFVTDDGVIDYDAFHLYNITPLTPIFKYPSSLFLNQRKGELNELR